MTMPYQQYRIKVRYNDATEWTFTRRATSRELIDAIAYDLIAKLAMGKPKTVDIEVVKRVQTNRTT